MSSIPNQPNLWETLDEAQKALAQVHATLTDPQDRQVLGEILDGLQSSRKEVQETLPQYVENLRQEAEAAMAEAEVLQAEAKERAEQRKIQEDRRNANFEEMLAKVPKARPPAMEYGLAMAASGLGASALTAELLKRFRAAQSQPSGPPEAGSIWSHMDLAKVQEEPETAPPVEQAAPPPQQPDKEPTAVPDNKDASLREFLD